VEPLENIVRHPSATPTAVNITECSALLPGRLILAGHRFKLFRWMRFHSTIPIRCFDGNPFFLLRFKSQLHKAIRTLGAKLSLAIALY
jgi:hypothetical protein